MRAVPAPGGRGVAPDPTLKNLHDLSPLARNQKRSHKLTVEQRLLALDLLARYPHTPTLVADRLRVATGVSISADAVTMIRRNRADEIAARRSAYLADLRGVPLAHPRERVQEWWAQYRATVRALFREPCRACRGEGTTHPRATARTPLPAPLVCDACTGRGWILPDAVWDVLASLAEDLRLDTVLAVEALGRRLVLDRPQTVLLDRLLALGERIRAEVGDAWSPRERNDGAGAQPPDAAQGDTVVIVGDRVTYIERLRALRGAPDPVALAKSVGPGGDGDGAGGGNGDAPRD